MLATAYAANALSVSVPLAGPELATAFTFRRFTRQGADAPLAGWSLLAGGVVSTAAGVLVVGGGGLASGNILATAVAVPGGVLAVAALIVTAAATRRPRLRGALERPAAWALRHGSRLLRRPAADPRQTVRAWADRLGSLQLPPSGWMTVTGLALANWLADAAVLAVSIRAAGAAVPWHDLLLVYGSGNRRAKPQHHARRSRGRRGNAQPGPGRHRAARQPGPGRGTALPPGQFLAGRLRRMAGPPLAAAPRPGGPACPHFSGTGTWPWPLTSNPPHELPARRLGTHELVLLHGQPGSPADWAQVAGRLPAQFHAVAADRPGYGSSQRAAGGFAANARAVLDDLDRAASSALCWWGTRTAAGWRCRRRAWRRTGWRRWSCSRASARGA